MYTAQHSVSTPMNGMGSDLIDGSGTINPAALNTPGNNLPSLVAIFSFFSFSLGPLDRSLVADI